MVFVWDMRTASARFALLQADASRSSFAEQGSSGQRRRFQVSDGGCSVTAPLGMSNEWLFYLAERERASIAIYVLCAHQHHPADNVAS